VEEREPAATNGREAMKERRRTIVLLKGRFKKTEQINVPSSVEISNISILDDFIG
jgi:hypothetical protein